jgi:butyryl-CoA dehydrogenase
MDFQLSEEERLAQTTARRFAEEVLRPQAGENDEQHRFPREALERAKELGFFGVFIPPAWGGAGMSVLSYAIIIEEIARVCASTAVILSVNNLICDPILRFGTDSQKERFLKPLARGEMLGCYSLSEPTAGSDAKNLRTRATRKGKVWILEGTKIFVTNGKEADLAIVFAVTDPEKGHKGITAFLVPTDTPGFEVVKLERKMGIRASSTAQIYLNGVEVPDEYRLGEEGEGFQIAMKTLDGGRIGISAQALGIAQGAFEEAFRYTQERIAFGQKIADFQGVQWMLADMATRIESARLLVYRAAWLKDQGKECTLEASMAKLTASETAVEVTRRAVQLFGGYGYIQDFPVERMYRDAKITEIYEGTSEIQRIVIYRNLKKRFG